MIFTMLLCVRCAHTELGSGSVTLCMVYPYRAGVWIASRKASSQSVDMGGEESVAMTSLGGKESVAMTSLGGKEEEGGIWQ